MTNFEFILSAKECLHHHSRPLLPVSICPPVLEKNHLYQHKHGFIRLGNEHSGSNACGSVYVYEKGMLVIEHSFFHAGC